MKYYSSLSLLSYCRARQLLPRNSLWSISRRLASRPGRSTPFPSSPSMPSSSGTRHTLKSGAPLFTARLTESSAVAKKKLFRPKLHPGEELRAKHGDRANPTQRSLQSGSGAPMAVRSSLKGRFNRVAAEKGFAFATVLYLLGESLTIALTLFFHWGYLGEWADMRYWLRQLLEPQPLSPPSSSAAEPRRWSSYSLLELLEMGPMLWEEQELRMSPRLLMHYGIANVLLWPLYPYQYALCEKALPAFRALRRCFVVKAGA